MIDDFEDELCPQNDDLAGASDDELKQAITKFSKRTQRWFYIGVGATVVLEITHKLLGWPANMNREMPWVFGIVGLVILSGVFELITMYYSVMLIESRSRMQRMESRMRRIEREIRNAGRGDQL